jgi:ubiquitin-conjugating enzyme E2 Q
VDIFLFFNTSAVFSLQVLHQVQILLRELCRLHTVPLPREMDTLALDFVSGFNVVHPPPPKMDEDMDEDDDDDDDDGEEDLHLEMDEVEVPSKSKSDEMEQEHLATLESLRQNQRSDYLKGSVSGSVQATDRLMKELRDIYRSDSFKKRTEEYYAINRDQN